MHRRFVFIAFILLTILALDSGKSMAQVDTRVSIARISYRGGGDWYNDPSALRNLISYSRRHIPISIKEQYDDVALGSRDLHRYPFAFMTGHGIIVFNEAELENVRSWLDNGGFLYIDDDYGFDEAARTFIQRLYPSEDLIEIPLSHPIYTSVFSFSSGLPKIHEHDNKAPQGFGVFREGRLVLFYTYESNLGDGWADPGAHGNPESIREKALQMGVNILTVALLGS
jgi:hypothetical protein